MSLLTIIFLIIVFILILYLSTSCAYEKGRGKEIDQNISKKIEKLGYLKEIRDLKLLNKKLSDRIRRKGIELDRCKRALKRIEKK